MPETITVHRPDDTPTRLRDAHDVTAGVTSKAWQGPTYYGRSQLKPAPFENWVVGGYIFLAGLSGAASVLSALLDATRGEAAEPTVRRGRYLSMLVTVIGPALLVWDLHTPKRFYNMLRIAKSTSPMSIGTWILMSYSAFASLGAVAQFVSDRVPGLRWLRRGARVASVPAAVAGAGLSTYTASLLSATSTPLWAAAPQALAVRFGASSVASGAAALSLGERSPRLRRTLDTVTVAALAAELAATLGSHERYRTTGVDEALNTPSGQLERWGATRLGTIVPLALLTTSLLARSRPQVRATHPGTASTLASLAVLAGSLLLRVSIMGAGDESAARPDISFRFSQPDNLPRST
ncbi:MAG: NrfD/PsrC family molybdoenzyme membrane anchor subunit [Acetobacteraceae bacterium]|nr:polysulfide reductase NrfD [Pseudomonadota bacterium]